MTKFEVGKVIKQWEGRNDKMLMWVLSCLSHTQWGEPMLVFREGLKKDKMRSILTSSLP